MSVCEPRGHFRELRVQWADEGETPSALFHSLGNEFAEWDDEADSIDGDGGDETWSPPSRQASAWRKRSSTLQQALPTSPPERRCRETSVSDDDSEEKHDWRYNEYGTPLQVYTSESECNDTHSGDSSETSTGDRKGVRDRLLGALETNRRGTWSEGGDQALMAAPVHASSSLLSPMFSPLRLHDKAFEAQLMTDYSIASIKEGTKWGYSARSAFAPSGLRPQPFAMSRSRSKSRVNSFAQSTRYHHHSSTAVHEPRARCGCRGLTVRVDSGFLGLCLEARYRIEHGLVLKQAWSDCAADRGMFSHAIHVQHLPSEKDKGHSSGALDFGFESRSSSSGLIRVMTVDPGSDDPRTTPICKSGVNTLVGSPPSLRPGALSAKNTPRMNLAGVLEVEEGDILVRVDDMQVTKKSFTDVAGLLERAQRPTRLTFVRHACGRRFVGREKGRGRYRGATRPAAQPGSPPRSSLVGGWGGCCGNWGNAGCGCEDPLRGPPVLSLSPRKSNKRHRQIEAEADGCPVAVLLRARRQLQSGGMEQWHEVVASRGQLWQRLLGDLSADSHSDRAKLRKLTGFSRTLDGHPLPGRTGISKRKLRNNFQRLISSKQAVRNGSDAGGCAQGIRALSAKVWKDVNRTMSPRRPGGRPGFFSASQHGGGGHVCPAHFAGGSKHAVFRVAYATASTLQFVSGISYMAALMLVQEPLEAMAYATLVTLLQ
ncbi:unnamed protein product, partial [Hapterophycus canaliculatus]